MSTIRPIKFVLLSINSVESWFFRDCTLGNTYEGNVFPAGTRNHGIEGVPKVLPEDNIIFTDDAGDIVTVFLDMITLREIVEPVVFTVKPKKPYATKTGGSPRQFTVSFKKKVVKDVAEIRSKFTGKKELTAYLKSKDITRNHLYRWEAQQARVGFAKQSAVGFSSNPNKMIKE